MCGILGVSAAVVGRDAAEAGLCALAWRGQDERRLIRVGGWWLGVARLVIRDASASQPIVSAEHGHAVAMNGALTDADAEFAAFAGKARTRNDAELPLLRFLRDGEQGLHLGPGHHAFAFVAADGERVWLVRDAEGEKPLWCWKRAGKVIAFASSVAALATLGARPCLTGAELPRFLRFGWQPAPSAQDQGQEILEIPPGVHRLDAQGELTSLPRPPRATERAPELSASERAIDLRARVIAATKRCATAEVNVALALSGGVDSACLAAALASLGTHLVGYQWCARGEPEAERERARLVASHTGHTLLPVDGGPEILRALPMLTACVGLPIGDPSTLAAHALARAAAADGQRVLLSGEGGDEIFHGYDRQRATRWLPTRGFAWLGKHSRGRSKVARMLAALAAPDPYAELLAAAPPGFLETVLAVPSNASVGLRPVQAAEGKHGLERAVACDRHGYLRWDLLPKLDTALMAAQVEGRCPFLDPEVVASSSARRRPGPTTLGKRELKRAFAKDLPRAILRQRKQGFGLPLDRWIREDDYLCDLLRDSRTGEREHIASAGLTRAVDDHRRGRTSHGHALYLVAALEVWLRWREHLPCA